jgi:hypothetical protein
VALQSVGPHEVPTPGHAAEQQWPLPPTPQMPLVH